MACKTFQFTSAVRGFHFYRQFWNPEPEQNLNCFHELNNPFDYFAIKICPVSKDDIVGHLPMEISRVTKFLIDRGAKVSAKLTSTNYRRSPLVQGGLEIPCLVTVTISGTIINQLIMERYKEIVTERYIEPKEEEIIGTFLHIDVIAEVALDITPVEPKKKKKKLTKDNTKNTDIRSFFTGKTKSKKQPTKKTSLVNIDKNNQSKDDIILID